MAPLPIKFSALLCSISFLATPDNNPNPRPPPHAPDLNHVIHMRQQWLIQSHLEIIFPPESSICFFLRTPPTVTCSRVRLASTILHMSESVAQSVDIIMTIRSITAIIVLTGRWWDTCLPACLLACRSHSIKVPHYAESAAGLILGRGTWERFVLVMSSFFWVTLVATCHSLESSKTHFLRILKISAVVLLI